jgi:IS1 family transposase
MNKLPVAKRAQILSLLCEGTSMRAVSRLADVSINTVSKLLVDAGNVCAAFHDESVRGLKSRRVQVDEIWSFTYAKAKNVEKAKKAPAGAGDTWTWTALDADSKMIVSWLVGPRDQGSANAFVADLAGRIRNRIQLTSDGLRLYIDAVEDAFGADIDYSMLIKLYGASGENETRYSPAKCLGCIPKPVMGRPAPEHISTSYVERQNLTMRMHMRRFTRLTNGFSKKLANHIHMVALYTVFYNWTKIHKTLRVTPAQQAGLTDRVWDMTEIVEMIEEAEMAAMVDTLVPAAQGN